MENKKIAKTTNVGWLQRKGYAVISRLAGRLPLRIISDNGQPYLERYYVGTFMGRRWYLHRFVGSDPQRGWHDHPWGPAFSLVLWGEYGEERTEPTVNQYGLRQATFESDASAGLQIFAQRIRWWNRLDISTAHRVVIGDDWSAGLDQEQCQQFSSRSPECWTLFCHPVEYREPWGFWTRTAQQLFRWRPFDNAKGTAHSGEWWNSTPIGKLHPQRVTPLDVKGWQ